MTMGSRTHVMNPQTGHALTHHACFSGIRRKLSFEVSPIMRPHGLIPVGSLIGIAFEVSETDFDRMIVVFPLLPTTTAFLMNRLVTSFRIFL